MQVLRIVFLEAGESTSGNRTKEQSPVATEVTAGDFLLYQGRRWQGHRPEQGSLVSSEGLGKKHKLCWITRGKRESKDQTGFQSGSSTL